MFKIVAIFTFNINILLDYFLLDFLTPLSPSVSLFQNFHWLCTDYKITNSLAFSFNFSRFIQLQSLFIIYYSSKQGCFDLFLTYLAILTLG